jgi:acetyl-CoA synthetase
MQDYVAAYANFSAEALAGELLNGTLSGGVNPCIECCDRWADNERIALSWMGENGSRAQITYRALRDDAARFANFLAQQGIHQGDVVAGMLPRVPELLVAILGTWRIGAIYQPLFTAFGPLAINSRIGADGGSGAKLLIVDHANRFKLDEVAGCPPVMVVSNGRPIRGGDRDFVTELAEQPSQFEPVMLNGGDPFILIFTSGTTGKPKGVTCPISALLQFGTYIR